MKPIIKKHPNGNQYVLTKQSMWVRNFTLDTAPCIDLNNTIMQEDQFFILENEYRNHQNKYTWIDSEELDMRHVVIVSDGCDFEKKQQLLSRLPKETTLIGVNGALTKWNITSRSLNWYVANNPYKECMRYLPRRARILPKCIASTRTNHTFLTSYRGSKFRYRPSNNGKYTGLGESEVNWQVDDYRNAVCAAIELAYRFGAEKIMLFCCDDSFTDERPGAYKLANGLYQYPQQSIAHGLIDAKFYWLKQHPYFDYDLVDHSSGQTYQFAPYISEEDVLPFFNKVGEK